MRASICERTQSEPLPYLRYMLSSQVRSASPNSLFSSCACGDSVLGIRMALTARRGGHIVGPIAGGLADQVHELAFRPDRIANAHQALVAQRVDRVEDEILDSRGFLDCGQEMLGMLPRRSLHARGTEPEGLPTGSDLDHRRAGLEAAGKLAPEREDGPIEAPSDLLEGHAAEHHLRRPRDDAQRLRPGEQPPEDDPRDPEVLTDHVAGIRDRGPVLDDRSAQVHLAGPVGSALQDQLIEQVRSVLTAIQQSYQLVLHVAVGHIVHSNLWPARQG